LKQPKKPKVGRPPLPKGNAKAIMLRVRITPGEQKAIESAAKSSKEKLSEWIRRSLGEAQVVKLMVRITDRAGNKYDWFIGPPQECPVLPRIGEHVKCGFGEGTVRSIEHAVEEIETKRGGTGTGLWSTYYTVLIYIGP